MRRYDLAMGIRRVSGARLRHLPCVVIACCPRSCDLGGGRGLDWPIYRNRKLSAVPRQSMQTRVEFATMRVNRLEKSILSRLTSPTAFWDLWSSVYQSQNAI